MLTGEKAKRRLYILIGFLGALAVFCFAQAIFGYWSVHCTSDQAGDPSIVTSVAHATSPPEGDVKEKHAHALKFNCSILGALPAIVTFMDGHEGFFVGIFTFFLFISTLLLWLSTSDLYEAGERQAVVTKNAAEAAKRSAEISERALIVSQRPYVRVSGFPWLWRPDTGRPGKFWYDIKPTIENIGNLPTVDMTMVIQSDLRDTKLPNDFDFSSTKQPARTLIGSRQTIGAPGSVILDDDLLAIRDGKKFFYIWGTITYRDGFEDTGLHTTEFCTYISRVFGDPLHPQGEDGPRSTGVEIVFGIYSEHNRTD